MSFRQMVLIFVVYMDVHVVLTRLTFAVIVPIHLGRHNISYLEL